MRERTTILFVCLGNICRSPLAEGVFLHLARARGVADGFEVDSAGTGGWHAGSPPDPRTEASARRHGVTLVSRARQVVAPEDFQRFEWLIAMDHSNARHLRRAGAPAARLRLLRSFDPALAHLAPDDPGLAVPDPYVGGEGGEGGEEGFEAVYEMVASACAGLLDELLRGRVGGGERGP